MLLLRAALLMLTVACATGAKTKRCEDGICSCIKKSGKEAYKKIRFPESEDYNCLRKVRSCQKKRFPALLNNEPAPACDSRGFYMPKQCIEVESCGEGDFIDCGSVQIQSKNFPSFYFGLDNYVSFVIGGNPYLLNIVSPGLTGEEGAVSFQSAAEPDKYLRHYNSMLYLHNKDNTVFSIESFDQDATFVIQEDKFFDGYVAFESVNFPKHFIRHQGGVLKISSDDGTDLMHNDASFSISPYVPPANSHGLYTFQSSTSVQYFSTSNNKDFKLMPNPFLLYVHVVVSKHPDTLAFRSAAEPFKALCHDERDLYLADVGDIPPKACTFHFYYDFGVRFESEDWPDYFIRNVKGDALKLAMVEGRDSFDATVNFIPEETAPEPKPPGEECWCVSRIRGKEKKNTRGGSDITCE